MAGTAKRPSRAKMNNWLAGALQGINVAPSNPMDIRQLAANAKEADLKISRLSGIASQLGWHISADLDIAWEEIQDYDRTFLREETGVPPHT